MEKQKPSIRERLNRYIQKKPNNIKEAKSYRVAAIVIGGSGLFCAVMGLFILTQLSWIYKNGFWILPINPSTYNNVSFLSIFSAITLVTMGVAVPVILLAFYMYARSLQYRLKNLEEKLEAKP